VSSPRFISRQSKSQKISVADGRFGYGFYSYKLVRGASDLGGVANRVTARSRYGGERPILLFERIESLSIVIPSEETEVIMRLVQEYGPRSRLIRSSAVSGCRTSPWLSFFHGLGFMFTEPAVSTSGFSIQRIFGSSSPLYDFLENNSVEHPAFTRPYRHIFCPAMLLCFPRSVRHFLSRKIVR
jgi:hypothetical protein